MIVRTFSLLNEMGSHQRVWNKGVVWNKDKIWSDLTFHWNDSGCFIQGGKGWCSGEAISRDDGDLDQYDSWEGMKKCIQYTSWKFLPYGNENIVAIYWNMKGGPVFWHIAGEWECKLVAIMLRFKCLKFYKWILYLSYYYVHANVITISDHNFKSL